MAPIFSLTDGRRRWHLLAIAMIALFVVLLANGALPGMANFPASAFVVEGRMRCLSQEGISAVALRCEGLGYPFGYPVLTGGPLVALGALLMLVPGVGSAGAYLMSSAVVLTAALGGGYLLMKRLGAGPAVAIGASAVYLISPTVLGLHGFGGTFFGFALLPAYAWVDLALGDALRGKGRRLIVVVLGVYAVVRTSALFMDGYSFVASALVAGLLWADWAWRSKDLPAGRRLTGPVVFLAGNLAAVLAYTRHASLDDFAAPLALFRSLGLDVTTLWLPTRTVWFARELGWTVSHAGLWGDGTNALYNYAGFACVALAAVFLLLRSTNRAAKVLAVAGALALVLSLGPALKVGTQRPPIEGRPTAASYMMPEGEAPELPWGGLFTQLPGIQSMRATYRWFGVTRMVLIVLAGLGVAALIRRRGLRRWAAIALATIAVVELAPDLLGRASAYSDRRRQIDLVAERVQPELQAATDPGQLAFFLNHDGSHNDWLANYLAPGAGVTAYNAGGDKNSALARQRWPEEVTALAARTVNADDVYRALRSGHVDVVVAPFFHLRYSAYSWPPPEQEQLAAEEAFVAILADDRFEVEVGRWLAVVTLASRHTGPGRTES